MAATASSQPVNAGPKHPIVVELYTSQGCSSCPPADALLAQLAGRKDLLALSLPVTYWDMLGWKDTLASDGNTRRQKAYAKELGRTGIYTPQIIVDGTTEAVGSREPAVQAAIAAHFKDGPGVPVELEGNSRQVRISVGAATAPGAHEATIWLFGILPRAIVKIAGGENGGRSVTYRNVVREIRSVGVWKGHAVSLSLPRLEAGAPHDSIAVLVQQGGYGRVVGAALIDRPDYAPIR